MKIVFPEIIFLSPPHILQEEMAEQLQVQSIGFNSGHFWEQVDLVIYLSRFKNKLLINLANTGPIFIRSQVITLHDVAVWEAKEYYHPLFSFWYRLMISQLVKKAKLIFTVSDTEKLKIIQRFNLSEEHVQVTYNGIANNMLASPLPDNLIKEKIILYVGAITAKKNVHILAEAFSSSNLFQHYKLILVGRESSIMGQAKFQVNDQIIWHKNLSDKELVKLYQKAECVVSLSESEGFGIPVLEALYFGCKVLCADIPVYRELFEQYVYFCNPQNFEKVVGSLETLPAFILPSRNQIKTLVDKYNYINSANIMMNAIQKLCSR